MLQDPCLYGFDATSECEKSSRRIFSLSSASGEFGDQIWGRVGSMTDCPQMSLNNSKIRNLKPSAKPFKASDSCLSLRPVHACGISKIASIKKNLVSRWVPIRRSRFPTPANSATVYASYWRRISIPQTEKAVTSSEKCFEAVALASPPRAWWLNQPELVPKRLQRQNYELQFAVPSFSITMPDTGIMVSTLNPKVRIKWPIALSVTPKRGTSYAICTAQPPVTKPLIINSIVTAQRPFCVIFISPLLLLHRIFPDESSEFPSLSGAQG